MIDSHCHLDHEPMYGDLKNVIKRSKDNGVSKILSICTTNDSFKRIFSQNRKNPQNFKDFAKIANISDDDDWFVSYD